jgi:hypothetical protein
MISKKYSSIIKSIIFISLSIKTLSSKKSINKAVPAISLTKARFEIPSLIFSKIFSSN